MPAFTPPPFSFSLPPPRPHLSTLPPPLRRRSPSKPAHSPLPAFSFPSLPIPTLLLSITLIRTTHLPQTVVHAALSSLLNTRVTRAQIFAALVPIDVWLVAEGFLASRVAVATFPSRANGHALVLAAVEPRVTSIRFEALDAAGVVDEGVLVRTRVGLVARAMGVGIGDVFRWHPRSYERLGQLGVFEFAKPDMETFGAEEVGIVLGVRERKVGRIEPGLGISSEGQCSGDLSAGDVNFLGRALRVTLDWQKRIGMERSMGGLEIADPRIGAKVPVGVRGKVFRDVGSDRMLPSAGNGVGRESDRQGVLMEGSWSPERYPRLALSAGPVVERVKSAGGVGVSGAEDQTMLVMKGTLNLTELGEPMPRKGQRFALDYAVGAGMGVPGAPDRRLMRRGIFQKLVARVSQYLPVGRVGTLALGGTIGLASQNLPWHEQSPLGGPSSVRGYLFSELGRSPVFATGRAEFRFPLITPEADEEEEVIEADNGIALDQSEEKSSSLKSEASFGVESGAGTFKKESSSTNRDGKLIVTKDGIKGDAGGGKTVGKVNRLGLPKLPSIVGVLFADGAKTEVLNGRAAGSCQGIGVRIGGILTVDYVRTQSGRDPMLHFGVVDRSL